MDADDYKYMDILNFTETKCLEAWLQVCGASLCTGSIPHWTIHLGICVISPANYIGSFLQCESRRFPWLVIQIIVLTSWGGVTMLCVWWQDHLSITQGSWGRGCGPQWRTSFTLHAHSHTNTHTCHSSEARLTKPQPRTRPLSIDLHTNKTSLILAHEWTGTDYTVYISMLRWNRVDFLWPI